MIKLQDLLRINNDKVVKVKLNINNGKEDPIELYKTNPDIINKQWLYWREKKKFFKVGEVAICLVRIHDDKWLLTTVDVVESDKNISNGINYTGSPIKEYEAFFGRIIVKYHKNAQNGVRFYDKVKDSLEVCQVLPDTFDDDDFPGYDKVLLSYEKLKRILDKEKRDWVNALNNQKAVYLITDKKTGKLYVGSATSDKGMLLSRWKSYIKNGHGGNVELKEIVTKQGFEYVKQYFTYSILENYNSITADSIILERESWWKKVLKTREFGYNKN